MKCSGAKEYSKMEILKYCTTVITTDCWVQLNSLLTTCLKAPQQLLLQDERPHSSIRLPDFLQTKHSLSPVTVWSHFKHSLYLLSSYGCSVDWKLGQLLLNNKNVAFKKLQMWLHLPVQPEFTVHFCQPLVPCLSHLLIYLFFFFDRHFLRVVWIQNRLPGWGRPRRDRALHQVDQHHVCNDAPHHGHAEMVTPAVP